MADNLITQQLAAAATTLETLYTVPSGVSTVISTLLICNRANAQRSFRVRIGVAGAGAADKDYIFYDTPIPANGTITATLGITLSETDVMQTYASAASSLSFSLFGVETKT